MTINSKQKGARYERHVSSLFKNAGYEDAHRTQQFCGYHGTADVEGVPGIHIECKHQERMQLYDWMAQAKRDARDGEIPVVIHKKNNCEDLVTMTFEDWVQLYREWECSINGNT